MLLFHRWSEVPSRGGVRGDSSYEKLLALQTRHFVFSECCFLARPSSVRTPLSGFVVLFTILAFCRFCSSQSGLRRAPS